jgi:hypothetical protein
MHIHLLPTIQSSCYFVFEKTTFPDFLFFTWHQVWRIANLATEDNNWDFTLSYGVPFLLCLHSSCL